LNVLQILPDSLEETLPPFVTAEPFIAVPVIGVIIAVGAITVISITPIAIITPVSARLAPWICWNRLAGRITPAPGHIKSISLRAIARVFDPNHCTAAIARLANKRLPASAVHTCKTKIGGISRNRSRAFKSTPLRRPPGKIP
jgi:hypothetical protein